MIDTITFPQVRYLVDGKMRTKEEIQMYRCLDKRETVRPVVYSGKLAWFYSAVLMARFSIFELALMASIFYY